MAAAEGLPSGGVERARKIFGKNTIDLQWKMRANYNARPCAGGRKAAGKGTMASNGKSNARSNQNSRKSRGGRVRRTRTARAGVGFSLSVRQMQTPGSHCRRPGARIRD